ncbi:hypothetical protein FACS189440_11760 [Bacteroidia bacterium]|nr:hypothetical protein FACS189423_05460 [Bacteroidia bacterium]GHT48363.1 hypothetical protein FACS189440_11760 [Bacteroidia bacterium]
MKTKKLYVSFFLFAALTAKAQNPIVPPGMYMADPSAHVWKDGKIYVYGSRDENPDYYCSSDFDVLSSSDMKHWEITRDVFASKGKNDQVPFSDDWLYAPDCQYKNGLYYLYFPLADWGEGVATSQSPKGPFTNGKQINLGDKTMIDPCVFIDDDGQAYYIWGQFSAKMAKLKPNMTEIDPATIHDGVVTEKEHFFHEGGYIIKRNGIYYFIYADISRSNRPSSLGYATSDNPFGPYKYRGVIIDDDHCDPSNWTNHGSIVEFKGQWYIFYHRSTHNSFSMRKVCVEPIHFNPDGSIQEVEMTTQGAGGPMDALLKMDAERACLLYGNTYIQAIAPDNEALVNIRKDDKAGYKYLDFSAGVDSIVIQVIPGEKNGSIILQLDQPWTPAVAKIDIPAKTDSDKPVIIRQKIERITGIHALWLSFDGPGANKTGTRVNYDGNENELFQLDWFQFK